MTAQTGDKLTFENRTVSISSEPFAYYLAKMRPEISFLMHSTGCWRGYLAEWEIKDDRLYLTSLQGEARILDTEKRRAEKLRLRRLLKQGIITCGDNGKLLREARENMTCTKKVDIQTLFPGEESVFAGWFTGTIRIKQGKLLKYIHAGYESVYEEDLFLHFCEGILTGRETRKNGSPGSEHGSIPWYKSFTLEEDEPE